MTTSQKKRLGFVGALFVFALMVLAPTFVNEQRGLIKDKLPDWWPADQIKLGLDLRGGSYLVLSVQTKEAVKSNLNTIAVSLKRELKKEQLGVVRVRQHGERGVRITLLGDRGVSKVADYMSKEYPELVRAEEQPEGRYTNVTYQMSEQRAAEIEDQSVDNAIETIRNRVDRYGVTEPTIQRAGGDRINVQLPDITNIRAVKDTIGTVAKLDFMLVADPNSTSSMASAISKRFKGGGDIQLEDEVLMSGDVIERANIEPDPQTNEIQVSLRLNSVGAKLFDKITADNVGRQLAIVLDGVVQSAPRIQERISGGTAQISGSFTPEEARRLAIVLRSGALPAPLNFEEERTVGASLGEDSIRKGFFSMAVGSLIVVVFIVIYYRRAGMLAVTALVLNMVFLLALLALLKATLTLPGIAGLVLTIGMAVDANIIIFERIREELKLGATASGAVEAGFAKAHWTILDANITTLLTGIILYGFGTGPIKGFAVTLCLGIITSLFSALYVARVGFDIFKLRDKNGKLSI